ncbi:Tn3 family transposase [Enterococcus wangshanyuanii]|uniref:DDE transposase n=1 Tax=Enterococcus wangshanyuanii TaxID=2005703 RepID=A0ABQ1PXI3_9ENTE|nr:Tn3 family transposase [Enterococcus wangshanyuanii]GGD06144.1 DDE transposase [Enterococcus wangshanyuanii]
MPVQIMSKEQKQSFGSYAGLPSDEQLVKYFHLDDYDKSIIKTLRNDSTKIGFAVQLGTVRFLGTFLSDLTNVPNEVIEYMAEQLSIESRMFSYYTRIPTIKQHALMIQELYSYRQFHDQAVLDYLEQWIYEGAWYSTEQTTLLADRFLNKCINEKIILPGLTTFERFISRIIDAVTKDIEQAIVNIPSKKEIERINQLTLFFMEGKTSLFTVKLDALREPLKEPSYYEIKRGFQRIKEFASFSVDFWDFSQIPKGKIKLYAEYTAKAKSQSIQRMPESRRLAYLVSFIAEYRSVAMDELLLALEKYFTSIINLAKKKEQQERLRSLKDLDNAAAMLSHIVEDLIDEQTPPEKLLDYVLELREKQEIVAAVSKVKRIVSSDKEPVAIKELLNSFSKFKRLLPDILAHIPFLVSDKDSPVAYIWSFLRDKGDLFLRYQDFEKIQDYLPTKWHNFIDKNQAYANKGIIIAAMELFIKGIKTHTVYVPYSHRYNDPLQNLIPKNVWNEQRKSFVNQLGLAEDGAIAVEDFKISLEMSYRETLKNWNNSNMARIEEKNGQTELIISPLKRQSLSKPRLIEEIHRNLPIVDLPEILLEVNQRLRLTECFSHLNENRSRMKELDISILAVLLAEACNIGLSPVAKKSTESLKNDRLSYVNQNYIRLDTLTAANNKVVDAYQKLALPYIWGTGDMASADGIRFTTPKKSLHSGRNPKYFGRGKGITYYNFLSDSYVGFHGMVISGTIRDSVYLLEGLLNQTSTLTPSQIMTDTAGYSDLVFGLFGILGFQFSPRIAKANETKIWRIDKNANYKILNEHSKNTINTTIIEQEWDDILRIAGSLKSGTVQASYLIRALQHQGNPTPLGRALIEVGKIFKTKHQLRYLSDEEYARNILEQLNKGESRHSLYRKICYGKNGRIYQSYFDGMENQLNALGLVANIIIYWNTLYMEKAIEQLQEANSENQIQEEVLQFSSPLVSEHINFMGKYSFKYNEQLNEGEFRPLGQ